MAKFTGNAYFQCTNYPRAVDLTQLEQYEEQITMNTAGTAESDSGKTEQEAALLAEYAERVTKLIQEKPAVAVFITAGNDSMANVLAYGVVNADGSNDYGLLQALLTAGMESLKEEEDALLAQPGKQPAPSPEQPPDFDSMESIPDGLKTFTFDPQLRVLVALAGTIEQIPDDAWAQWNKLPKDLFMAALERLYKELSFINDMMGALRSEV